LSDLDVAVLADRVAAVERHLDRVAARLPSEPEALLPATDASDAVILHLWQAVQIVIDLAVSLCVRLKLGTPTGYGDAFARMASAGHLDADLAGRLAKAAGFRNVVAHAYDSLDMARVWDAARVGPSDLRAFLVRARDLTR
jgi:uncharacterized protein YutE (UPF0331/DUF86 family)